MLFRNSTAGVSIEKRRGREVHRAHYFLIKCMHWLYTQHLMFVAGSLSLSFKHNFLPHPSYGWDSIFTIKKEVTEEIMEYMGLSLF